LGRKIPPPGRRTVRGEKKWGGKVGSTKKKKMFSVLGNGYVSGGTSIKRGSSKSLKGRFIVVLRMCPSQQLRVFDNG